LLLKNLKLALARRRFPVEIKPNLADGYYLRITSQLSEQAEVTFPHFRGSIGMETNSGENIGIALSYME
jgi:hypothetical protein